MAEGTINIALLNFVGTWGHDVGDKAKGRIILDFRSTA